MTVRRPATADASLPEGPHRHPRAWCAIAVMAKASLPGRTKTRLVPPLTDDEAATLNTVFLRDAAASVLSAATLAPVSAWMAYAPAGSEAFFRTHLPESVGLVETAAPTLGECLSHAAGTLLGEGHGAVCLINGDSPTLPVRYLVAAATVLEAPGDRIVLGPATDGGYYLIGMKRLHAELFEAISWSTDRVLTQTIARAEALGLAVASLPAWYDVDDAGTLQTLVGELIDGRPFRGGGAPATSTREHIAMLIEHFGLRERLLRHRAAASGI